MSAAIEDLVIDDSYKGYPNGIAAGSDGRVWYTDLVRNVIGRLVP